MSEINVSLHHPQQPESSLLPITPQQQILRSTPTQSASIVTMTDRSPADIKRKLEQRLADTKSKMYNIGRLGESLVKQEQELNDRIKEMELHSHEEEIRPELRSKLAELENGFKEIERESAKAFMKTIPFLSKENMGMPRTPGLESPTKSEFVGHGTISPSKSSSSRKLRNATPRQQDIEFAADIGQGLLEEVRKLQVLLAQRDQKLNEATTSISRSDRQIELLERKVKQMYEEQETLKEENWNVHLRNQDLQSQVNATSTEASKLQAENMRLLGQTTALTSAVESLKQKNTELSSKLSESKTKHDTEMSSIRRAQAGLQRERSDLQRHLDELKSELQTRPEQTFESWDDNQDLDDVIDEEQIRTPVNLSPTLTPQLSPIKNTPSRNAPLELETTKSSLHHAHRMVNNLRNTLHREKTEKLELKRLLAAAQDEVEQLRHKASGAKRAGKRPQVKRSTVEMLGSSRRPHHEITMEDDPNFVHVDWNDEAGSTSAAYVTANEDEESDVAFITAAETTDGTDTDAYRTGIESPLDSEDDGQLTETESESSRQPSSHMPDLGYIRDISPGIAFTSDEEDSPIRMPTLLRNKRSVARTDSGRRIASSQFDPPPQPLFQELMEGGGSSVVNSPISVLDSPTSSHGTAVPLSPLLVQRHSVQLVDVAVQCEDLLDLTLQNEASSAEDNEQEKPEYHDVNTQCDPIPDPQPIIVESPPVVIYKDPPKPEMVDESVQSDPIPEPEPIIIHAPPVVIYKEREPTPSNDSEVQTDHDPHSDGEGSSVIASDLDRPVGEEEKAVTAEIGIQSDPVPLPEPIVIQSDPIIIEAEPVIITKYVERQKPESAEAWTQSDPMIEPEPTIVYVDRQKPESLEMGSQHDPALGPKSIPLPSEASLATPTITDIADSTQSQVQPVAHFDKDIQTLISIPLLDSYQFDGQSVRPKTPNLTLSEQPAMATSSRVLDSPTALATPRTFKSSSTDWEVRPQSPLKEITNAPPSRGLSMSPSKGSMRYQLSDAHSTFSSRAGSVRRYNTILERPTLQPSPRSTVTRSRISSPTKRHEAIFSSHSRGNTSIGSRRTGVSRRTSFSSFESEVDNRFGLNRERTEEIGEGQYATSTDPRVIQAITHTMIGEYLHKYTRDQLKRSKISENRHRRFFWIHPYTKTLYWSSSDPAGSNESNRNTRSAPIKKIAVVTDENPFPPGLYHKSILCFTQSRAIKFTAPTETSHDTWLMALNHLLDRGPMMEPPNDGEVRPSTGTTELSLDMREFGAIGTRRHSSHMASMSTLEVMSAEGDSDIRSRGSFARLSSVFRTDKGNNSTIKGKAPNRSIYEASMVTEPSRHSLEHPHEHIHDINEEGVENVRACCGGKHDIGTLSKRGGAKHGFK